MKICVVGQGAFGKKHLDGLKRIKDAEVISIYGRTAETTKAIASMSTTAAGRLRKLPENLPLLADLNCDFTRTPLIFRTLTGFTG